MSDQIMLGPVHHLALRVTILERSIAFYQALFGFQVVVALPDVTLLSNGTLILGLRDQGGPIVAYPFADLPLLDCARQVH